MAHAEPAAPMSLKSETDERSLLKAREQRVHSRFRRASTSGETCLHQLNRRNNCVQISLAFGIDRILGGCCHFQCEVAEQKEQSTAWDKSSKGRKLEYPDLRITCDRV